MFPVNSLSMAAPAAVRLDGKTAAALAALSASAFAYVTAENLPVGLLPELEAGLGRSPAQIGALVTAYGAVIVVLSIPLTRAARGLDRRLLLSGLLAAFALLTLASGVAPGYDALLSARVATAASQAVFWSLVVPTAAALVPAELRGRAMSLVFGGASVGVVVGVPAGTWLGQVGGWRLPFLALGGVGLVVAFSLLRLLPDARAESSLEPGGADAPVPAPSPGGQPSVRAYAVLAVVTVLGTGGAFIGYTYITTFLGQVTHLSASSLARPCLLAAWPGWWESQSAGWSSTASRERRSRCSSRSRLPRWSGWPSSEPAQSSRSPCGRSPVSRSRGSARRSPAASSSTRPVTRPSPRPVSPPR